MLPVAIFIAFWVAVAFGVFFVAASGGPGGARQRLQTQSRGGRKFMTLTFLILYVGFGVAIPLAFLTGNHANANRKVGTIKLTAADKRGRELFGLRCGVCHTLAAANSIGKVGPNLDDLKPPATLVLNTINNGCLQSPPSSSSPESCLGQGNMPAAILQGKDAQDVANFVGKVAGNE